MDTRKLNRVSRNAAKLFVIAIASLSPSLLFGQFPSITNPPNHPMTESVTIPISDIICAHAGDVINSLTCSNAVDATTYQNYVTAWVQPAAPFWYAGRVVKICGEFEYWSSTVSPTYLVQLINGVTQLYAPSGNLTPGNGKVANGFGVCWNIFSADAGANLFTQLVGTGSFINNSNPQQSANTIAQPRSFASGPYTYNIGVQYSATGIASGTYTSGVTAIGTAGQTCTLATFNNANTGGTATVALTGINAIAGGTALVITNTGYGSTSAATSATAGSGTATCSGTATVSTVLGGAQGNGVWLQALIVTYDY